MTKTFIHGGAARYYVIMHGTTGNFMTDYKSKKKAEQAAENMRLLGFDAEVIEA